MNLNWRPKVGQSRTMRNASSVAMTMSAMEPSAHADMRLSESVVSSVLSCVGLAAGSGLVFIGDDRSVTSPDLVTTENNIIMNIEQYSGTWRRTVEEEIKLAVKTWIELGCFAQDRSVLVGKDLLAPYAPVRD